MRERYLTINVSAPVHPGDRIMLFECDDCGALVMDKQTHDKWHDRFEKVATNARTARERGDLIR